MESINRKQFCKLVSLLLVIVLLCQYPLNAVAIGVNETEKILESEASVLEENVDTEVIPLISTSEVPNFISQAQIEEYGHISRLSGEETLNTLVYLNRDGTKTKYIMDYPVKYIDENGDTKFVDLSLGETTTAFETTANDIVLSVAKDYTKGITLTYKDYLISLVAVPNSNRTEFGSIGTAPIIVATKNNNAITYNDVFGTDIDIRYSPVHNGVKEDIILHSYNGVNTFDFLLNTGGLGVYSEKDNYYLAETAKADMRMDLGKVIVYDANRRISEGSLTVTALKENQLYQVTVSVDQAFLTDPNTVYPVQIDPSITVSDTTHGANAVIDCPVYSGKPTVNMGNALYNPIGYLDSAYQIGRTAVKLVGLANDPVYQGLITDQIQSAYFYIKDSSGTAAKTINLYALTKNSTWTESSLTWNTLGITTFAVQASANVGGAAWSSFDITNLVKQWKSGFYDINCGFVLQSSDESTAGNFFSSESSQSNWPYIVLTYQNLGVGGGNSFDTADDLGYAFNLVWTMVAHEKRYYKFTPITSGEYMFYSTDVSNDYKGDPIVNLYDSSFQLIDDADDEAYNQNFRISANLVAGRTYYFELGHDGTKTGAYCVNVTQAANLSGDYYFKNMGSLRYMDIHGPDAQELVHQWSFTEGNQSKWTATKQSDGYYTIRSLYGDKKYVGISDTYSSTGNIVLFSSISDDCKWKIYKDYDGNLIFETKKALGRVLCAPNNNVGTELGLVTLSSIVENRNFWKELQYKYDYTIAHYYDQGFVARFPEQVNLINTYQDICSDAFLAVFGVSIGRSVQSYTSCADTCVGSPVTLAKTLNSCSHSITHKTRAAMCVDVCNQFGYGSNTTTRCIWTGHLLESKNSCSYSSPHNVIMMNLGNVTDNNDQNLTDTIFVNKMRVLVLVHEASHQLGAADHYCYDLNSTNCDNPKNSCWRCDLKLAAEPHCIMSSHFFDIESMIDDGSIADIYCSTCKSSSHQYGIERHLRDHHD